MTFLNFLTFIPRKQVHINSMYITKRPHEWVTTQPTLLKKKVEAEINFAIASALDGSTVHPRNASPKTKGGKKEW